MLGATWIILIKWFWLRKWGLHFSQDAIWIWSGFANLTWLKQGQQTKTPLTWWQETWWRSSIWGWWGICKRMTNMLAILTTVATPHSDCEAPLQPHHILIITSLHYWDCREPPLPTPHHLHHCATHLHHHLGGIARHHGQPHHRAACACIRRHHLVIIRLVNMVVVWC